tara:strand:- start:241 stop:2025 length:1785 start_codon:yes stop_codon:yes gene_type:complete
MAKKETLNLEVKSNIKSVTQDTDKMAGSLGDVNEEAKDSIGNFNIMGVSLNGVKSAFGKIIPLAKTMFGTIKAGIISTGIGALLIAFGALMTWFTKTKAGAEALEKVFAGIGAAVSVVIDRISSLASVAKALFSGDIKGALTGLKNAFTGIGTEIRADVAAAIQLEGRLQSLRDSERDFNKVRAQTRQDIQKARLEALDESKSAEERLASLQRANDLELKTTKSSITLQEEKIAVQNEQMSLAENLSEDLDVLSGLEVGLIDLQTQSFQTRKRLATEMETLTNEIAAKEKAKSNEKIARNKAAHAARMKEIEEEKKAELEKLKAIAKAEEDAEVLRADGKFERATKFADIQNENYLNELTDLHFQEEEKLRIERDAQVTSMGYLATNNEERLILDEQFRIKEEALAKKRGDAAIAAEQAVANAKANIRDANINNISAGLSLIASLAGDNKQIMAGVIIAENAMGIAKTIINTQASNAAVVAQGAALSAVSLGASVVAAKGLVVSNNIAAGISIAASVAAAGQGLSALGKGGATGGTNPTASGGGGSGTPAPQMMSGAFELTEGVEPEPLQAFVVSDDITDSQNGLEVIRRRATI